MRVLVFLGAIAALVLAISTSYGDVEQPGDDPGEEPAGEAITGSPADPNPTLIPPLPAHDPLVPYEVDGEWSRAQLGAAERAVADRGTTNDQAAVQDAYASASAVLADEAEASAAASQLGFDDSPDDLGVIP